MYETMTISKNTQLALLTAILILAAATRMLHLGDQAFWLDEGSTYFILTQPDMFEALSRTDVHPPLFFMLLRGWVALAGWSEVAMRMFAVFFSILCVALIVPLAKVMNRGRAWFQTPVVWVLAALMLTLSDPDVVLAQDARQYTLRSALSIICMIGYLRWAHKPSWRRIWLWFLPAVALMYIQYQSAYLFLLQGLHALLFLRGRIRVEAIATLALVGVAFLPWALGYAVSQSDNDFGIFSSLPSDWWTLTEIMRKYISTQWGLMLLLMLLGTLYLMWDQRRVKPALDGTTFLLVMWIALTLGITFVWNLFYPVLAPHRLLFISIPIAILIAQGLRNIRAPERWLLVGAITIFGLSVVDDYYPKEPWDDMARSATQYNEPGDLALLEVYRGDNPLRYYLDQQSGYTLDVESLHRWREFRADEYPQGIIDIIDQHDHIWLLHWSPDRFVFDFLAQTGHVRTALQTTKHLDNDLNVYRFDRVPEGEIARFENGMILRDVAIHAEEMRVDLWWTSNEALPLDYSVSAFLLDASGQLAAQHDGFPFNNARPTTGWSPGEVIYDPKPLQPATLPPGTYTVAVQLYTYFDGVRYRTVAGEDWATVGTLTLTP
jgi:uncharacterized membrane protein